jgi:spermidine/putrescine transport system permease protein
MDRDPLMLWLLLSPARGAVALMLLVPPGFIVVCSFWLRTATGADQIGFFLGNWTEALTDPVYRDILFSTLCIAAIPTVTCALLGYVLACFIARTTMRDKSLLLVPLMPPFWISYIFRPMLWIHMPGASQAFNSAPMALGITGEPLRMHRSEATVTVHCLLRAGGVAIQAVNGTADAPPEVSARVSVAIRARVRVLAPPEKGDPS